MNLKKMRLEVWTFLMTISYRGNSIVQWLKFLECLLRSWSKSILGGLSSWWCDSGMLWLDPGGFCRSSTSLNNECSLGLCNNKILLSQRVLLEDNWLMMTMLSRTVPSCRIRILNFLLKNHLESLPDCQKRVLHIKIAWALYYMSR